MERYELIGQVPLEDINKDGRLLVAQKQEDEWRKWYYLLEKTTVTDERKSSYMQGYWRGVYEGALSERRYSK